jgi:hypothetical protein
MMKDTTQRRLRTMKEAKIKKPWALEKERAARFRGR